MTWAEHRLVRDGTALYVREWGRGGPAVVLLHGLAGHCGEWEAVAPRLAERHRVIAVDQRGHGRSERSPADMSREVCVADVLAVLDHLTIEKAVLVGHSLGGHTAMLFAAAHPRRVETLVLVEAGCGGPSPSAGPDIRTWLGSWPTPFPTLEAAEKFFGGGPRGCGWAAGLEQRGDGWWPRFDAQKMVEAITPLSHRAYWEDWERLRCPTLLVLAESSFLPQEEVLGMLRTRPQTTAVCVPGTGHDLHLDKPAALLAALGTILDLTPFR